MRASELGGTRYACTIAANAERVCARELESPARFIDIVRIGLPRTRASNRSYAAVSGITELTRDREPRRGGRTRTEYQSAGAELARVLLSAARLRSAVACIRSTRSAVLPPVAGDDPPRLAFHAPISIVEARRALTFRRVRFAARASVPVASRAKTGIFFLKYDTL